MVTGYRFWRYPPLQNSLLKHAPEFSGGVHPFEMDYGEVHLSGKLFVKHASDERGLHPKCSFFVVICSLLIRYQNKKVRYNRIN